MKYQTYQKTLKIIFCLFGILFVIYLLKSDLDRTTFGHAVSVLRYFFLRILVLFLLFFSIYAQLRKVKEARTLEKPFIFIIFGIIALALYIGVPISFYFMTSSVDIESLRLYNINQFEKVQKEATDPTLPLKRRHFLARQFYLDTGKAILLLDANNDRVTYSPDIETLKQQNQIKESMDKLRVIRRKSKITAYSLMILLVLSSLAFIAFLRYKSKSKMFIAEN